jgi:hypothetical protein
MTKKPVLTIVLALGCSGLLQATPPGFDNHALPENQERHDQDRDRDRDRDHDRDRDEHAYYSNPYYQRGWKDGQHHKHKNRKWKNDNDRLAYEAGYAHGERGERWQKPDRDHDRH